MYTALVITVQKQHMPLMTLILIYKAGTPWSRPMMNNVANSAVLTMFHIMTVNNDGDLWPDFIE